MRAGRGGRWSAAALIVCQLMLLAGPAASASGSAHVRFVQAVPGVEAVRLEASQGGVTERIADGAAFGEVGSYASLPAGAVAFEARRDDGRAIAAAEERLADGAYYTVLALGDGERRLAVLRDGRPEEGAARLRVVQAAPELGEVDVRLGGRTITTGLPFEGVARYETVDPGTYDVEIRRPDDGELAVRRAVPLTAGTSSTAFVVGSGGEPLRVVVASDRTAAPAGAPATGLGGIGGGGPGLVTALLAALAAASLGVAGYLAVTGRTRGHGS